MIRMKLIFAITLSILMVPELTYSQDGSDSKKSISNSYRENIVSLKAFLERDFESGLSRDVILTFELDFKDLPNLSLESIYLKKKDSVNVAKDYILCQFDVRTLQYMVPSAKPKLILTDSDIYYGESDWNALNQIWVSRFKNKSNQSACELHWSSVIDMDEFKTYLSEIILLNQTIRKNKDLNPW